MIVVGVAVVRAVLFGTSGHGGGFGFGNLYILYDVDTGGLLPDRLAYAVITPDLAEQTQGSAEEFTFVFAGDHVVKVPPRRGETVWVDEQYQVAHLGRLLYPEDIAALQKPGDTERSTISSAAEFLAIVVGLRAASNAPAEPSATTTGEQ
ncbi:MAG: hypothetical protein A2Y77_15440 [Planctomycetes bacterium RBG_13_62_9]|nr:MAG: hypothetical protein A2Y77_15440 [Planctomycetes bacterium RBG_13_62_9]